MSNLKFEDDIIIKGTVEIRAINGANVVFKSGVRLDSGVRVVATNKANVLFSEGADIGCYSIFNCGDNFSIGRDSLVAGFCYFQTSDHKFDVGCVIKDQGYRHGEIKIGDDCWIAGGSFILSGVQVEAGCVIGANSVVNKSMPRNAIIVGSPAKIIGNRG
ncbi:MAG: acyltransferase [Oceanospirillaceae bacterium]|nr:acyltransferase [Oceanospirillaceae bacterium]